MVDLRLWECESCRRWHKHGGEGIFWGKRTGNNRRVLDGEWGIYSLDIYWVPPSPITTTPKLLKLVQIKGHSMTIDDIHYYHQLVDRPWSTVYPQSSRLDFFSFRFTTLLSSPRVTNLIGVTRSYKIKMSIIGFLVSAQMSRFHRKMYKRVRKNTITRKYGMGIEGVLSTY